MLFLTRSATSRFDGVSWSSLDCGLRVSDTYHLLTMAGGRLRPLEPRTDADGAWRTVSSPDDFSTGHSSLALLRKFPLDTLKID